MLSQEMLKDFNKSLEKAEGISSSALPPKYWYDTGNYVLNYIISGEFDKGIPQGRITALTGPSGSGKSFVLGNLVKNAQDQGAFVLIVDSENALDDDFMSKIGVDTENNYMNKSVITIPQAIKVVSTFLKKYRDAYFEDLTNAPQVLIAIDSLDMLSTESELEHFDKGDGSSDQGLRAKQLKQMLRQFVQAIKDLNVCIVVTSQVYKATAQQILAGEGEWVINSAIRFALSQIVLLTRLKLKNADRVITGIRMKAVGFKTRFTQPFQEVVIEVPYTSGMNKHSGLIEMAESIGVIIKRGSRYSFKNDPATFYAKDVDLYAELIIEKAKQIKDAYALITTEEETDELSSDEKLTATQRRKEANSES